MHAESSHNAEDQPWRPGRSCPPSLQLRPLVTRSIEPVMSRQIERVSSTHSRWRLLGNIAEHLKRRGAHSERSHEQSMRLIRVQELKTARRPGAILPVVSRSPVFGADVFLGCRRTWAAMNPTVGRIGIRRIAGRGGLAVVFRRCAMWFGISRDVRIGTDAGSEQPATSTGSAATPTTNKNLILMVSHPSADTPSSASAQQRH